ncbi:hypothetical protein JCM10135_00760 [Stetteria hydrogenophila]
MRRASASPVSVPRAPATATCPLTLGSATWGTPTGPWLGREIKLCNAEATPRGPFEGWRIAWLGGR